MTKLRNFLKTKTGRYLEHIAVVFLGGFGTTILFNGEHIFAEHGLSALKSAVPGLLVAAVYAGWAKIRPMLPQPVVREVEKTAEAIASGRAKKKAPAPPAA